ncbi:hypothetical protein Plec18170_004481 [Paecilomyces lecythidis]
MGEEKAHPGSSEVAQVEIRDSESPPIAGTTDPERIEALDSKQISTEDDSQYPSGPKMVLIILSAFIGMFLVSLIHDLPRVKDRMIVNTAIPKITDDFKSVGDIGWYGSGYQLTTSAFQLLFGKIYSFYSTKVTFLATIFLFEVGSAISGAAPNSVAFIVGRAIAGIGGSGIASGAISIIVHTIPLRKRPLYQGMFGSVFGIASIIGPLLGGVFTSKVSWRWCFYINLPFGGFVMLAIFFLLDLPRQNTSNLSSKAKLAQLDFYGTALIVPGTVCLLLALQWGGLTYPWSDGRIIALLVLAGVLLLSFALVQTYLPKTATIAPRIFMQRSILAGFWSTLCAGAHMMIFFFYLPLWFQAIQGLNAVQSGIRTIPLIIAMVIATITAGAFIKRIGYYTPVMIVGICIMSVGAGLLTTLKISTSAAKLVSYQVLYGCGLGLSSQAPSLAAQTVLPKPDIPISVSLMFFSQLLSGAIFVSVGQNIFENQLIQRLASLSGFSAQLIESSGATALTTNLPASIKGTVLVAYNESLRKLFQVGLILSCIHMLGALAMEWRSVKENTANIEDKKE